MDKKYRILPDAIIMNKAALVLCHVMVWTSRQFTLTARNMVRDGMRAHTRHVKPPNPTLGSGKQLWQTTTARRYVRKEQGKFLGHRRAAQTPGGWSRIMVPIWACHGTTAQKRTRILGNPCIQSAVLISQNVSGIMAYK